jgi:hypothetical protein
LASGSISDHGASRTSPDVGEARFIDVVSDLGAKLRLDGLTVFARWITPAMMPKRFDTWFYVMHAPADQVAACDGRETVDAEWIAPAEAVRRRRGRADDHLPNAHESAAAGRGGERGRLHRQGHGAAAGDCPS